MNGEAGRDDFRIARDLRLVVSERVLDALKPLEISNALIEPFEAFDVFLALAALWGGGVEAMDCWPEGEIRRSDT